MADREHAPRFGFDLREDRFDRLLVDRRREIGHAGVREHLAQASAERDERPLDDRPVRDRVVVVDDVS